MLGRKSQLRKLLTVGFIAVICLIFFCEYIIYYVVLGQCFWPTLQPEQKESTFIPLKTHERHPVRAIFIADTHLLGRRKGHWFDKLRREWAMYRTFQTTINIHKPEIVFVLGDIFDEGQWSNSAEFDTYVARFNSLFAVPKNTSIYVVAGNHDIGFHYVMTPFLNQRFINSMKAPNVERVTIRGNHFVLINSMSLEGDGCSLCRPTEIAINEIANQLKCSKGIGKNCQNYKEITNYSRPILLQHFPMYRESDSICSEPDQAPDDIKNVLFRERWDCLSKDATKLILDLLNPRLIIDGHTHHGCQVKHANDIIEITIPSFSWRNKNNPSFLMGIFTPNNYVTSKCYMPVESTIKLFYIIGAFCILLYIVTAAKSPKHRHSSLKMH